MMEENKEVIENKEVTPVVIEEELPFTPEEKKEVPIIKIENTVTQVVETKSKRARKNIFIRILNVLAFLLLLFVVFETVIAFLNFNMIRQKKEPNLFVTKTQETRGEYDYTIYDMGLYKIVRKDDLKNYEIRMLPFFLDM